jgi:hypothetical protein
MPGEGDAQWTEWTGPRPQQERTENAAAEEQIAGRGEEGSRAAEVTPPIGQDAQSGQTLAPAPAEDVGVSSDEELGEEGAGESA